MPGHTRPKLADFGPNLVESKPKLHRGIFLGHDLGVNAMGALKRSIGVVAGERPKVRTGSPGNTPSQARD